MSAKVSWLITVINFDKFIIYNFIIDVEYSPTLRIIEKYYEADNITVTLEWSQHESVTYSHKIVPLPVAPLMSTESGSYQLTLLYDTKYNVSVVATTPCRPNATDFIILHYGEILVV